MTLLKEIVVTRIIEYHKFLVRLSHNAMIENINNFIIILFTPMINPIHKGVYEVQTDLQKAIMARNEKKALEKVSQHTDFWIKTH